MAKVKVEFLSNTLTSQGIKGKGDSALFLEKEARGLQSLTSVKSAAVPGKKASNGKPKVADTK